MRNRLKELSNGEDIKLIRNKLNKKEYKLKDLQSKLEEIEKKLTKNNFKLNELDYKFKNIEKDLYEGTIADLKQLGYLDKERNTIEKEIENKEIEILLQIEDMECIKEDFKKNEDDFRRLKLEYNQLIKKHKLIIEELKEKSKEEIKNIEMLYSKIDENILKRYVQLKKIKGYALAEIIDNKCSGCNMLLPTIIIDRLENDREIINCENCQRILYLRK